MSTNGQAKVLTHDEIILLFVVMNSPCDRALFGSILYRGLRVSKAISMTFLMRAIATISPSTMAAQRST